MLCHLLIQRQCRSSEFRKLPTTATSSELEEITQITNILFVLHAQSCRCDTLLYSYLIKAFVLNLFATAAARQFRAKLGRSFATVTDAPVRRYGGLKDQDRIFQNAYCRHDHGIKGAQVRFFFSIEMKNLTWLSVSRRLAPDKRHHIEGRLMDYSNNQGFWFTRAWWCRFPFRSQMEFHEQARLGERSTSSVPRC